jgi:phosphoribosylglycinamide formyltransferase-1
MLPRLAILLSGSGSTYANLVEVINAGRLPAQIAVVISSRADAYGLERAHGYGHPSCIVSTADGVVAALRAHQATWVAMCGWMRYFDPPAEFTGRVFNIHPSLLPAFGGTGMYGIHVHRAVIAAGVPLSGCTVHRVQGAYDTGEILGSIQVAVLPDDSAESLQLRIQAAERDLYPRVLAEQMAIRI